jgi:N-acetylneuraminic acid mutarotase
MIKFFKPTAGLLLIVCLLAITIYAQEDPNGYWFTRPDLPTQRQEILPAGLDGKIYVIGGWLSGSSITELVEVYDPATGTWSTVAPYPRDIHHVALAGIDGKLYAVGGYWNISWPWFSTDQVWAYDPVADEWSWCAQMIVGRGEHSAVVYEGKIYVTGGNDINGDVTSVVEVYDPVADSWTEVAPMLTPRHHHASCVVDSLIYVVGGRQGYWGDPYTSIVPVEAYSPASDTWYTVTDIPNPRGGLSAAGINGKLYTFGGEIPGIFEVVEEYDPAEDVWRFLTPMLTPRHGTAAAIIEDTVFIIGGSKTEMMGTDNSNEGFVLGTCVDTDHDGYGDTDDPGNTCPCPDNCPDIFNPDQADDDGDNVGDSCDVCPGHDDLSDFDEDGVPDSCDNCPTVYNPEQIDDDDDGIGNLCEYVCGDANDDGNVNILDITFLIAYKYMNGPEPEHLVACDVNGSGTPENPQVNILDITYLIAYKYMGGPEPNCP